MAAAATGAGGAAAYDLTQGAGATSPSGRKLFRDPTAPRQAANIMYDKRVVRGNTFAAPIVPPSVAGEMERKAREEDDRTKRRQAESRKRAAIEAARRAATPEPVPGRAHADVQTETFLEVISDRAPEFEVGTQTDALLDRPATPLFVPKPRGVDADTQIEPGELFDFDREVTPLLEVLVGKTIETAVLEVAQERELAAIRARQREYEAVRNAEMAEVQRLEGEVKRRQAEKMRRLDQERQRRVRQAEVQQKVAASAFARSCLMSMRSRVLGRLHEVGFFYDPVKREVEEHVLPTLYAGLREATLDRETVARTLADHIIADALERAKAQYTAYMEEKARLEAEAAAAKAAAEEAARVEAARIAEEKRKKQEEEERAAAEAGEGGEGGEGGEDA